MSMKERELNRKKNNPSNLKEAFGYMVITLTAMEKKHIWRLNEINIICFCFILFF